MTIVDFIEKLYRLTKSDKIFWKVFWNKETNSIDSITLDTDYVIINNDNLIVINGIPYEYNQLSKKIVVKLFELIKEINIKKIYEKIEKSVD